MITAFESEASNGAFRARRCLCGVLGYRSWHDDLYDDLAPLTIIERGFDGEYMNDLLVYADRIILPCMQRCGAVRSDDDIAGGLAPETVHETFSPRFKVHAELPKRVFILSIDRAPVVGINGLPCRK